MNHADIDIGNDKYDDDDDDYATDDYYDDYANGDYNHMSSSVPSLAN